MFAKDELNALGISCDEAENGLESIRLHREGKQYDLVLMDKDMPIMDGHEVGRLSPDS
jgi:CheY-like chemotaxis protein